MSWNFNLKLFVQFYTLKISCQSEVSNLKMSLPFMHSESGELERWWFSKIYTSRKFSASVRNAVISNYVLSHQVQCKWWVGRQILYSLIRQRPSQSCDCFIMWQWQISHRGPVGQSASSQSRQLMGLREICHCHVMKQSHDCDGCCLISEYKICLQDHILSHNG